MDLRHDGLAGAAAWLDAQGATIYHSVPSIFERMLGTGHRFDRLRVIRLEGDLAAPRHVQLFRRHFAPGASSSPNAHAAGVAGSGSGSEGACARTPRRVCPAEEKGHAQPAL
ncbi:MAG: hypothetical protein KIT17_27325 [Rubrivivax sp.]|nr:hypothetical protein [Rubrivivax sp.]